MNMIADELLAIGIAAKREETIEQQSIPVIREAIQTELRKALAVQREQIREDMSLEFTNEFKAVTCASDNRLAALLVRAIRDSSISKRSIYTVLSKLVSPSFATDRLRRKRDRHQPRAKTGHLLCPYRCTHYSLEYSSGCARDNTFCL
jgi:hypothetical protein